MIYIRILKICVVLLVAINYAESLFCIPLDLCVETSITSQQTQTTTAISNKEKEVIDEYKDYKDTLETKKDDMLELLKTLREVEALLKANQIKHKKILKYWSDIAEMHTDSNSK